MDFRGVAMYFYDSSPLLPRLSNYFFYYYWTCYISRLCECENSSLILLNKKQRREVIEETSHLCFFKEIYMNGNPP